MKQLRNWVPFFGILALTALFFKLPESASLVGCKTCSSHDPYPTLMSAGYFAMLIAISLLFPAFPHRQFARAGLTWSILLAISLTFMNLPNVCGICLIGHSCNILIWTIWVMTPSVSKTAQVSPFKERLCIALFAPASVIALFSCLNLTFMAYNSKTSHNISSAGLQKGDAVPIFAVQTTDGRLIHHPDESKNERIILNFVSADCPYCKEQLPILNAIATQLADSRYRFINVSVTTPTELLQQSPATEWIEDKEGELRRLFKVFGYPTMFVLGTDGKITKVIAGVPEQLKSHLLNAL